MSKQIQKQNTEHQRKIETLIWRLIRLLIASHAAPATIEEISDELREQIKTLEIVAREVKLQRDEIDTGAKAGC